MSATAQEAPAWWGNAMEFILPPTKLGTPPPWAFADGPVMFVFAARPEGHRCAWSCRWATAGGVVGPNDWMPVERMGHDSLTAELADLAGRGVNGAREMLDRQQESEEPAGVVLNFIRDQRENYPEYIYPYNPPETVYVQHWRPGWDKTPVEAAWDVLADDPPEAKPSGFRFRR